MAWLQQDPSDNYHVSFRFGGKKYKRSLHTKKRNEAESQAGRIEDNIRLVERGILTIPAGSDIPTFLLSDGKLTEKVQIEDPVTLGEMFDAYFAAIPAGNLEETTIYSMKIHKKHLIQHLGANIPVQRIDLDALQGYVANRQSKVAKGKSKDGSSDRKISGATIKKEIVTFRCLWNWALRNGLVEGPFPGKQVKYPKITEKPPFQTWQEIEKQINRGGLTEDEQAELWDSLFLSLTEVSELLDYVEKTACHPFVYPMVIMAAHTGARRSEIIRSMINDFQDDTVIINERKRVRGKLSTRRVPLSSRLKNAVAEWLKVIRVDNTRFAKGRYPVPRAREPFLNHLPLTKPTGILSGPLQARNGRN